MGVGNGTVGGGPVSKSASDDGSIQLVQSALQGDGPPVSDHLQVTPFMDEDGGTPFPFGGDSPASVAHLKDGSEELAPPIHLLPEVNCIPDRQVPVQQRGSSNGFGA